jgi:hypothetical protein
MFTDLMSIDRTTGTLITAVAAGVIAIITAFLPTTIKDNLIKKQMPKRKKLIATKQI